MQVFKVFALFVGLYTGSLSAEASRPNIIFILCDDLGPGDLGVLWQNARTGSQKFATPHLDSFASEGMVLSRHYCPAPVCAPSRASLLSGRHQGHSAIRDNQFDKELPNQHTLGTVMQQAGYATAVFGKWGLQGGKLKKGLRGDRSATDEPSHPLQRGFDYFYGYTAHIDGHYQYPKEGNRPVFDGYKDVTDELAKCYSTDLFTARAKKWIVDHQKANKQQPFFAYLSYTTPHAGLRVPTTSHQTNMTNYPAGGGLTGGVQWNDDVSAGRINTARGGYDKGMHPDYVAMVGDDGQPWPKHAKRHATIVRRVDDAVMDIVQLLKDLKIDQNTLIVFTSDNGTHNEGGADGVAAYKPDYFDTFGPYDGIKRDLLEGGVRMPTLVRWPSMIEAGSHSAVASQFHDWMATFCDLAGIAAPALSDGVSLKPTLTGKGEQQQGVVYVEYNVGGATPKYAEFAPQRRGQKRSQMQSVLIGDYKGVRFSVKSGSDRFAVYHTLNDPKELVDLAGTDGVPSQLDYQAAVLRLRRNNGSAKRPYDTGLIPALKKAGLTDGKLLRKMYAGDYVWVPHFTGVKPVSEQVVNGLELQQGAQQLSGYLRVPEDGVYHFKSSAAAKCVVRLHQAVLLANEDGQVAHSGAIHLQAGLHQISINLLAQDGDLGLQLYWKTPESSDYQEVPVGAFSVESN